MPDYLQGTSDLLAADGPGVQPRRLAGLFSLRLHLPLSLRSVVVPSGNTTDLGES